MNPSSLLIVEDDRATLSALFTLARSYGFCPVTCDTPNSAIKELGETEPDALIIDWELGCKQSGIDVARAAAACDWSPTIVMITGANIDDLMRQTEDIPVLDYLRKPFARTQLEQVLTRVLKCTQCTRSQNQQL